MSSTGWAARVVVGLQQLNGLGELIQLSLCLSYYVGASNLNVMVRSIFLSPLLINIRVTNKFLIGASNQGFCSINY